MSGPAPGQYLNTESENRKRLVAFGRFFLANLLHLAAILAFLALVVPRIFRAEVSNGWLVFGWTLLLGLPISLFEYLYHRYLLHSAVLPFMAAMHRAHNTHHGLTCVKAPVTPHEPAKLVPVTSEFPIEEEHQEESMMFPLFSLPIFVFVLMILLGIPLKLMLPAQPILVPLVLAVTLYLALYEVWHAVLHLPFEQFWQPLLNAKATRKIATHMYSFHLMHHLRPTSNLAIVGFWGIAVWDHDFRTHRRPERLPLHGAEVNYYDAKLKTPLIPIPFWIGGKAGSTKPREQSSASWRDFSSGEATEEGCFALSRRGL